MLKEEFVRVMKLFREAAEGKQSNLEGVLKESLQFFEHVKDQMATGAPEDRKEALQMMTQMYQEMIKETKKIAEKSGITQKQLDQLVENPANFSKEQWNALQASKEQIKNVGKELEREIRETAATSKESSVADQQKRSTEPKKPPRDKHDRQSKWMRS